MAGGAEGADCRRKLRERRDGVRGCPPARVLDYVERFRQAGAAGEQVIIDGNCLSACIGMLPRDRVCATPKAVLGFHAAFRPTSDGRKVASTDATQFMMNTYPPQLRKWISQRGGLTTQMLFLSGRELASFVSVCGTR